MQSAKSLGKNISYTSVGSDGKVSPLPNPEEYKPGERKIVTKVIKSSKSHTSSGGLSSSSSGSTNQKESKAQSDKEAEEKGRTQDNDTKEKPQEGSGSGNKKTPQEGKIAEGENKPQEGNGADNKKTPQEGNITERENKTQEGKASDSENKAGEGNIGTPDAKPKDNKKETLPKENEGAFDKSDEDKALENASEDFIILNEHLYADKTLKYKALEGVNLEDSALIGLKLNGENNGVKLNVKWEGKSLEQVKSAQKGEYQLAVSSLQDLVINDKNYGKVKFIVKIIIE